MGSWNWTEKTTIIEKQKVRHVSSFGSTPFEERIITYNIWVNALKQKGGFEMYSNDDSYYASGELNFRDVELVDFDGVYSLSKTILDWLDDLGFDVRFMKKCCLGE